MSEMVLEVAVLRGALNRVLNAVGRVHGEAINLRHDYYWHLWAVPAVDLDQEPTGLTMGQVSDDLESVQEYLRQDPLDDDVAIWHDLHHIIGLLRELERLATP
jgi:hypothetical protein